MYMSYNVTTNQFQDIYKLKPYILSILQIKYFKSDFIIFFLNLKYLSRKFLIVKTFI